MVIGKRIHRYRKNSFGIFLLLLAGATGTPAQIDPERLKADELVYVFEPVIDNDELRFWVDLYFRADFSGETTLILPSEWAGQFRYFEGIRELQVTGARVRNGASEHIKKMQHSREAGLHVRYLLVQDRQESFSEPGAPYRPILDPKYFHFIGHAALVHPEWNEARPVRVTIHWKNLPRDWTVSNSFATNARVQEMTIPPGQLLQAIYVGGDFRVKKITVKDNPVYVAMRGTWEFADEEFVWLVENIVRSQRAFWGDQDFPYYLITLIPTGTECCSYGGTGLQNSFATFISTNRGIDVMMKNLLSHELLHAWIGQKISVPDTPDEPEALFYWFSEGFTDYYARELLLRAGLVTLEEYLADFNKKIFEYYISPARNLPNSRIPAGFWKDRQIQELPYQRGALMAQRWDGEIRMASSGNSSLDDVMRELLVRAGKKGFRFSGESLDRSMKAYLGRSILDDIKMFIEDGETNSPAPRAADGRARLGLEERGTFDIGFNLEKSRERMIISGVRKKGPAYEAGLRNGQKIRGLSVRYNDPTREAEFTVADKDGEKTIRYLPVGNKTLVPQYRMVEDDPEG